MVTFVILKDCYVKGRLHSPDKRWNKGCEMLFFNFDFELKRRTV